MTENDKFNYQKKCLSTKLLITPKQLRSRGVHAVSVGEGDGLGAGLAVTTERSHRGARPWNAAPQKIRRKTPPAQHRKPKPDRHPPAGKPKSPDDPQPPLQGRLWVVW